MRKTNVVPKKLSLALTMNTIITSAAAIANLTALNILGDSKTYEIDGFDASEMSKSFIIAKTVRNKWTF